MGNKTARRTVVMSNGNQAPYGIGEVIKTFPATDAGLKKAAKYAAGWYNRPTIWTADGERVNPYDITEVIR